MPSDQSVLTGPGAPVVLAATWEIEVIADLLATLSDVDIRDDCDKYWHAFRQIRSVSARLKQVNSAVMSVANGEAEPENLHQFAHVIEEGCAVYSLPEGWPEAQVLGGSDA